MDGRPLLAPLALFALLAMPSPAGSGAPHPTGPPKEEFVIYATEPGWLRVGPRSEYAAVWKRSDEIAGGRSSEPLQKVLLAQGYDTREAALGYLCDHLTDVQLRYPPPTSGLPIPHLTGNFRDRTYKLRLAPGFDEETASLMARDLKFYKALEYDWESEWDVLAAQGITPLQVFPGGQWLVHVVQRSSTQGPQKEDRWMCSTIRPHVVQGGTGPPGAAYTVRLADGYGGTIGYQLDVVEGPFRNNWAMAEVMQKLKVPVVDLWPPVTSRVRADAQPRVHADKVPGSPRNWGEAVLPMQPIDPDHALEDWVVYVVEGRWLTVGTRYEFERPLMKNEVIWGGRDVVPAEREVLLPAEGAKERFTSRIQALRAVVADLTEISIAYHPNADPRETVHAKFRGKEYELRLDRGVGGDRSLEHRTLAYSFAQNVEALRRVDPNITPKRLFGKQWLVFATGHNTYYGPREDNRWMMISAEPRDNGTFIVPDGLGGTFTYRYSQALGPFTDSYALIEALRPLAAKDAKMRSVTLGGGGYLAVSVDEVPEGTTPVDHGTRTRAPEVRLVKITPDSAAQGDTLGILIVGANIDNAPVVDLGPGITVENPAWLGRDPGGDQDQWVATARIATTAEPGKRDLAVHNADGTYGDLSKAFEVREGVAHLCPPIETVVPAGAADWIFAEYERTKDPKKPLQSALQRDRLLDSLHTLEDNRGVQTAQSEEVRAALEALAKAEKSKKDEDFEKALKDWSEAAVRLRMTEKTYLWELSALAESLDYGEEFLVRESVLRRLRCEARNAATALDSVRAHNSTLEWTTYTRNKRIYDVHRKDAVHLAGCFQAFNGARLAAAQRLLGEARRQKVLEGRLNALKREVSLRPFQRRMRDAFLDMGETGLWLGQIKAEESLLDMDAYLAGVWGVKKQTGKVELAEDLSTQAAQGVIFGMKYLLAFTGSAMGAGLDSLSRVVNFYASAVTDNQVFDTVSSDVSKKIKSAREKLDLALKGLERLRGMDDEATAAITARYTGDAALVQLEGDRNFQEQTSGGLQRLAACYETDPVALMDRELGIAVSHAELVVRDMKKAFNARVLAEPNGKFSPVKRLLTNPIGVASVLIQNSGWGGDHFSAPLDFIAHREAQVQEMESVRDALRKVDFDPLRLRRKLPHSYALHIELAADHPDYLQWTLTRDRLAAEARADRIADTMRRLDDEDRRRELGRKLALNRSWVAVQAATKQARIFQMQGVEKLMVWDYDGALESFYQASEMDPKGVVQSRQAVEDLRKDLIWQKTVEAGVEAWTQLGNGAVHSALFAYTASRLATHLPIKAAPETPPPPEPESLLLKPLPFSRFTDFVWEQVNPFAGIVRAGVVEGEWKAMGKALAGLGQGITTQTVQKEVVQKGVLQGYLGVDEKWADFLANALVNVAQAQTESGNSLLREFGSWLYQVNQNFRFHIVDIPLYSSRREARRTVSDFYKFFAWAREFHESQDALRARKLANAGDAEVLEATEGAAAAAEKIGTFLEPVTREFLQKRYEDHFEGEGAPAPGTPERIARIREFLRGLPWKGGVMELKLSKSDPLNRKVDNLRRELISTAQVEFLADPRFSRYGEAIESILFIGSAGRKDSSAYKLTDSDIDFTILVKESVPESERNQLREDFMGFFAEFSGGMDMEELDMSVMVDPVPRFYPTGESVPDFLQAVADPARRAELREGIEKTLEQLVVNASDKERYLDRGNLFRHNLSVRAGGYLKRPELVKGPDGVELAEEPSTRYDELYGDVPLEPWMAFDAVAGNMGYVYGHALEKPRDMTHYQKVLAGKYAIRGPVFALLLGSPRARARLKGLTRAEVDAKGWEGAERVVVEVAKEILAQPDGMKELGLPTTLQEAGKDTPTAMGPKEWRLLLDEMILRKEGAPIEEVFGKPRRLRLESDHKMLGRLMADNIARTEALYKAALRKSIMDQATAIQELNHAAREARAAGDTARADAIDLKIKEIFTSQLAVWDRMSRDQQLEVMKNVPPEADWWVAIDAAERLRAQAGTAAAAGGEERPARLDAATIRAWNPQVPARDDKDSWDSFLKRVEAMHAQALQEEPDSPVLESAAAPSG